MIEKHVDLLSCIYEILAVQLFQNQIQMEMSHNKLHLV